MFKTDLLRSVWTYSFCTGVSASSFHIFCRSQCTEIFTSSSCSLPGALSVHSVCQPRLVLQASAKKKKKKPSINLANGARFWTVLWRKGHPVPTRALLRQSCSTDDLSGCRQWCAFLKASLIGRTKCQYRIDFPPPSSFSRDVSLFFSIEAGRVRAGSCARS